MTTPRINSRAKGATFERDVARDLRFWLGPEWTITRTPTDQQRDQAKRGQAGEFTVIGPRPFPWAIECKAGAALDLRQFWRTPIDGPIPGWWAQARRQAVKVGARPMLVLKVARGETLCVVEGSPIPGPPYLDLRLGDEDLTVCLWDTGGRHLITRLEAQ